MYRYKRILVAMSLDEKDAASIRWAGLVSRLADSEKVTFMHVTPSVTDIPAELREEFPDLREASGEPGRREIENLASRYFPAGGRAALDCRIVEGSPLIELLRAAKDGETDLIVMAKRQDPAEAGSLPEKLTRRAPCSVLLVPENAAPAFSRILVPTDFSENSIDAMDVAVAFASARGIDRIYCLHAYKVPSGYYKTGKNHEQFAEIMRGHAERNFRAFSEKEVCRTGSVCRIGDMRDIQVIPMFRLEKKAARAIEEEIARLDIDLLAMGTRGRHALAGVLLGSVAEHQIKTATIPVLAVKKKGTGLNLLDALLKPYGA